MVHAKRWALMGGVWLAVAVPVWACNIPVFKNSLDNKEALPYLLFECRKGAPAAGAEGTPANVDPQSGLITNDQAGPAPNLERFALDLSRTDDPLRQQLEALTVTKIDELLPEGPDPRVLILWPLMHGRANGVFWSGPLKDLDLKNLTDSPTRRELSRRLVQRNALVWVFVPSGDKEEDDKAEGVLRETLRAMEERIRYPDTDVPIDEGAPGQDVQEPVVPMVKPVFSTVRLVPGQPEERFFERMLRIEEFWKEKRVPLAYPVCGRGRLITALAGKRITPDGIAEICDFSCGPCSCQVDPGYDLLLKADWAAGSAKAVDAGKAPPTPPAPKAPAEGTDDPAPEAPAVPDTPAAPPVDDQPR